jgi:hypothetical protein
VLSLRNICDLLQRELCELRRLAEEKSHEVVVMGEVVESANRAKAEAMRAASDAEMRVMQLEHAAATKSTELKHQVASLERRLARKVRIFPTCHQ